MIVQNLESASKNRFVFTSTTFCHISRHLVQFRVLFYVALFFFVTMRSSLQLGFEVSTWYFIELLEEISEEFTNVSLAGTEMLVK